MSRSSALLGRVLLRSRFARNFSILVVANLVGQALGMLAAIRIARALAPEGFGQFNLVQTVSGLAAVIAGLGIRNVVIRECARHPDQSARILYSSALPRLLATAMVAGAFLLYSAIDRQWLAFPFAVLAVVLLLSQAIWDLAEMVVFGHERMEYSAGLSVLGGIAWAAIAWGTPSRLLTPLTVCLAFVLVQAMRALAFAILARRLVQSPGLRPEGAPSGASWSLGWSLTREGLPFYWMMLITAATNQLPILFLAARSGRAEVGLYTIGFRLMYPIDLLIASALAALYPGLSRMGTTDGPQFTATVRRALLGLIALATTMAIVVSLLRREVVLFLFGPTYLGAADAMAFQCWYSVLFATYTLMGTVFGARDRQRWIAWLSVAYTVISLPIIWGGAARGATGLAAAIVFAAVINMAYHWVFFQRSLPQRLPDAFGIGLLIAFVAGIGIAWIVPQHWPFLVRMALAGGMLLLVGGGLLRREVRGQSPPAEAKPAEAALA